MFQRIHFQSLKKRLAEPRAVGYFNQIKRSYPTCHAHKSVNID